jgi:DNA-3-methyladenine glycosylase
MKLKSDFYLRGDVVQIARDLIGKILVTGINGYICEAMITETEAYAGVTDKASHANGGKFTARTRTMYLAGEHAYVYLCYGIHHLFNLVTNIEGTPHAVLIRAAEPISGTATMLKRRRMSEIKPRLSAGPGALAQALGIHTQHSGESLSGNLIWIEDAGIAVDENNIAAAKRIGVDYAKEDALLPYRFYLKSSRWVSKG